jgi:hypothetical protein
MMRKWMIGVCLIGSLSVGVSPTVSADENWPSPAERIYAFGKGFRPETVKLGPVGLTVLAPKKGAELYPSLKGNDQNRGNMVSKDGPLLWQSQVVGLQENPNYVTFEGKQIPVIKSADVLVVGSTLDACFLTSMFPDIKVCKGR